MVRGNQVKKKKVGERREKVTHTVTFGHQLFCTFLYQSKNYCIRYRTVPEILSH